LSLPLNWLETALTAACAADWVEFETTWRRGIERRLRE